MPHEVRERRYSVCEPCEYHHRVNAFYGSHHSWTDWECRHPKADEALVLHSDLTPAQNKVLQDIDDLTKREGRWIGRTEKQPEWCPLRKENE